MYVRGRSWKSAVVLLTVGLGAAVACYGPTQLTLEMSTDAACSVVKTNGVSITVARTSAELSGASPVATSFECDVSSNLGTLVLTPSGADDDSLVIQVMLGVDRGTSACAPPNAIDGCVIARRRIRYQRHRALTLPVRLEVACIGVSCKADETCSRGKCISAEIAGCEGDCDLPGAPDASLLPDVDVIESGLEDVATPPVIDAGPTCPPAPPPSICATCGVKTPDCCVTEQGVRCVEPGTCPDVGIPADNICTNSCQCAGRPIGAHLCGQGIGSLCPSAKVCGGNCFSQR